jgi:hypothetical protein
MSGNHFSVKGDLKSSFIDRAPHLGHILVRRPLAAFRSSNSGTGEGPVGISRFPRAQFFCGVLREEYFMFCKIAYRDTAWRQAIAVWLLMTLVSLATGRCYSQEVHMLFYNNANWTDQNLNGVSPNAGVAAFVTTPNDQQHVYYMGGFPSTHVHQLFYNGKNWADEDLTAETGAPDARGGAITGFSVQNFTYVYYVDKFNSHVHQLLYNNIAWADADLTSITGGPSAWDGDLVAFTTTPALHIFYMDAETQHIHQIFNTTGTNWQDQDLTEITGGTLGSYSSIDGMAGFNIDNFSYLYFVSQADGHVHQFLYNNSNWSDQDLTALTKSSPSQNLSHSVAAFVIPGTNKLRVYLQAENDHILQLASTNNLKWNSSDLTKKTKGPLPDTGTSIAGFATTPNKQLHIYYASGSDVNQLFLPTPSTTWQNEDLTAETKGGAAHANDGVAGFSLQNLQYLFYVAN